MTIHRKDGITSMILQPARKFSFVIEGAVGPNALSDAELRAWLVGVRNMVLMHVQGAMAAVPVLGDTNDIALTPLLEDSNAAGGLQHGNRQ